MVITRDDFEKYKFDPNISRLGPNEIKILVFLYDNNDEAFTRVEIQTEMKMKYQAAVSAALNTLHGKGFIEVRAFKGKFYWRTVDGAIEEDLYRICESYKETSRRTSTNNKKQSEKAPIKGI